MTRQQGSSAHLYWRLVDHTGEEGSRSPAAFGHDGGLCFSNFHTMFMCYDPEHDIDDMHIAIVRPRSTVERVPGDSLGLLCAKDVEVLAMWRVSYIRETHPRLYSRLMSVFMWQHPEILHWISNPGAELDLVVPLTTEFVVLFMSQLMEQLMFRMLRLVPEEEQSDKQAKTHSFVGNGGDGRSSQEHPTEFD